MLTEEVAVLRRRASGSDAMGDEVWAWEAETVPGCLVRPLAGTDEVDAKRPEGASAEYAVAFPKDYTASMAPLRGARIALTERGMDPGDPGAALMVRGSPDVTRPCPTRWDVVATAGRQHG